MLGRGFGQGRFVSIESFFDLNVEGARLLGFKEEK